MPHAEIVPTIENVEHAQPLSMIEDGLNKAEALGFDLRQAIASNYDAMTTDAIEQRYSEVLDTSSKITTEAGLEEGFFDKPAHTILLTAVADSWLDTEKRAENEQHNPKLADERAMLVDVLLMAAGKNSSVVRQLITEAPTEAKKYVSLESESNPLEAERREFLESINDEQLAEDIKRIMRDDAADSILAKQREMMNLTPETEIPFAVKVLKVGNFWDLRAAGVVEKTDYPDWEEELATEEERQARLRASRNAANHLEAQQNIAKPYEENQKQYEERFTEELGELPEAFVDWQNGEPTLYLSAAEAAMVKKLVTERADLDNPDADYSVRKPIATLRHEYAHTQKQLLEGERNSLGMILEERKAEFVSHDSLGYNDIKYLFNDLSWSHDKLLVDEIESALKEDDPLSTFMSSTANLIGLRNLLVLYASKPTPYDADPTANARFADMRSLKLEGDKSVHDALLRSNFERKGDEKYRMRAARWAASILLDKGLEGLSFIDESYIPYREHHGVTQTSGRIRSAVYNANLDGRI